MKSVSYFIWILPFLMFCFKALYAINVWLATAVYSFYYTYLCHNIDAESTLWSFFWLRREVGEHGLESHMEKLSHEGDWRWGGDVPTVGRNRILLRYFWSVQRCGSGAMGTQGLGLQLSSPSPKHKLKTTDFVDMLTSRFYMIYASA